VIDRRPNLSDEIRLMKQFMKGIGVYGAESKVEGFSGYLVEVLIIYFGGFLKMLEAVCGWSGVVVIDSVKKWEDVHSLHHFFTNASLIVVDPVDKSRNVAAALSAECLGKFKVFADDFLTHPSMEFFYPVDKPMRSLDELTEKIKLRGTHMKVILFKHEKLNTNILYAQIRRTLRAIIKESEVFGFKVFKTGFYSDEANVSMILLEFSVYELPSITHHLGPPIDMNIHHIERFKDKYRGKSYIKDGRWVVDRKRKYCTVDALFDNLIVSRRGFGKNLRELDDVSILSE